MNKKNNNTDIKTFDNIMNIEPKEETNNSKFEDIFSSIQKTNSQIPNKFFNFLEDESVNMNIEEPKEELTEEIELLDFIAPSEEENNFEINIQPKIKDMFIANNLLDKLELDLKNNNYKINILKDENSDELKYTIVINKKED